MRHGLTNMLSRDADARPSLVQWEKIGDSPRQVTQAFTQATLPRRGAGLLVRQRD